MSSNMLDWLTSNEVLIYAGADALLLALCVFVAKIFLQGPAYTRNEFFYGDTLHNSVYFIVVSLLATDATLKLYGSVDSRWHQICDSGYLLGIVQVARHIAHLPYLFMLKWDNIPLYTLHHVIVIYVYGSGCIRGKCVFWGCLLALCEISNIWLTFLDGMNSMEPTRALPAIKASAIYKICSVLFNASYVLFRLVLYPIMLVWFYSDAYFSSEESWHKVGFVEQWAYPAAAVFVLTLSVVWAVAATPPPKKALAKKAG
jgi:hypothetical protein